jgi:putative phosphoribosyl transferase
MNTPQMIKDREEAGRLLAARLEQSVSGRRAHVFGLSNGGVIVGAEIARRLALPMDVIVVRKLHAGGAVETEMGAVAPEGVTVIDEDAVRALGLSEEELGEIAARERSEVNRRQRNFQGEADLPALEGMVAILADDGMVTGIRGLAAVRAVRHRNPEKVILAVGVCPSESVTLLEGLFDEVLCLTAPRHFSAVRMWYSDYDDVPDEEAIRVLRAVQTVDPEHEVRTRS